MTAISIFTSETAAYLLSDQGHFYTETGNLFCHQSKAVRFPDQSIALAHSGHGDLSELMDVFYAKFPGLWLQAELVEALPVMLKEFQAVIAKREGFESTTRIYAAMFDHSANKPRVYCIATDEPEFLPGAKPFQLVELEGVCVPAINVAEVLPKGYISRPKRDARKIITAQRKYSFESLQGASGVSGDCELVTISKRGTRHDIVAEFNDPIGFPIRVSEQVGECKSLEPKVAS